MVMVHNFVVIEYSVRIGAKLPAEPDGPMPQ